MTQEPLILFSRNSEQRSRLVNDQCDCACPESGFSLVVPTPIVAPMLRQAKLHTQPLGDKYSLLFNPLHEQGVAVMNTSALKLWHEFQTPRLVDSLLDRHQSLAEQMLQAGLLEPVRAQVQLRRGQPETLCAWLHVTNECNLRCDYCYVAKTDEAMLEEVGHAAIQALIRSAINGGFKKLRLKFAGGEATLNLKLVFALHSYALEQTAQAGLELESVILSNGVAIGEKAISEFIARGLHVMISLDGIGEMHDAQRQFQNGKGSFAWVNRTLDRLIKRGMKPFISITVTDRNVDGLADVVRYVLERGLYFNLNFFHDNECAAPFSDLQLQNERLIAALNQAFDVIEENLPDYNLIDTLVDRAQFDRPHDKTCSVGDSYMVIDHRGHVAKCQMEIERPVTTVFAEDPLAMIRLDQVGVQNVSVDEKEGCRDCEWKYWCAGGCPLHTYRATGRYDVKSPYCQVYKAIYPRVLRLEGLRLLKINGLD